MSTAKDIDLDISGMTCASCVNRVEKSLNRLPGVDAVVNLATERARVHAADGVAVEDLVAAVASAGYQASVRPEPHGRTSSEHARTGHGSHDAHAGHEPSAGHHAHGGQDVHAGHDMTMSHEQSTSSSGGGHMHSAESATSLRRRFVVAAVLAAPVVAMSMIPVFQFPYWQWVSFALALPVVTWAAWPFHRGAWSEVRHLALGMDTLVSLGIIAAFGWSTYALVLGGAGEPGMHMTTVFFGRPEPGTAEIYLEVATAVTALILLGRWIEARAKRDAGAALRALLELGAKDAALVRDGVETTVPVASLVPGDLVRVRPGGRIPSDGVVREGDSAIDASMLTGESVPVEVSPGAHVSGGTVNANGTLLVEVSRIGADTELARIARLVEDAQMQKSETQRLADRISAVFVPIVIAIAVLTLVGWLIAGQGVELALTAAIATLIIACPCALGLATPVAILVGTSRGSQLGILIAGPDALERTRRIDTVLLDKTGTLTLGRMLVTDLVAVGGSTEAQLLALAAAAEQGSEHPIAQAIVVRAGELGAVPAAESFAADAGFGIRAEVRGSVVAVGRAAWVANAVGAALPDAIAGAVARIEDGGGTAVVVAAAGAVIGAIGVADTTKPSSAEAITAIRAIGVEPILLTGDNAGAAGAVARELGITSVRAGVDPAGKVAVVEELRTAGHAVAMVGDGINDAAALASADLGIAMGGGTDAAIAASDITLVGGDPRRVADAIRLARRTLGVIRGNLFWAFAYNVAAVPLAVAGLLNPIIAGAAMAFSSVFVVLNSLRLRAFR